MSHSISRAQFLRGDFGGGQRALRPPWAVSEELFRERCEGCGVCAEVCPEGILHSPPDRLPQVDFGRGRCTFCGACVDACSPGALQRSTKDSRPWAYQAGLGPGCLAKRGVVCRSCSESCDEGAIRFRFGRGGVASPEIDATGCTGCGGCVRVCPVGAIAIRATLQSTPPPEEQG